MTAMEESMFTTISQVGVVVCDMDRFVQKMEQVLGVEPVNVIMFPNEQMKNPERYYYGEKSDFTALFGFFKVGQLEIEAIQPLTGQSIWQTFLDEKGEGIHHIRFSLGGLSAVKDHFNSLGLKIAQNGYSTRNVDGLQWMYFDTCKELGFFVEVFNEYE